MQMPNNALPVSQVYTSSHSLAELGGVLSKFDNVHVTCFSKEKVMLEHRMNMFMKTRLKPNGQTYMVVNVASGADLIGFCALDEFADEDTARCRGRLRTSAEKRRFDRMLQAQNLCRQATKVVVANPLRQSLIDQARKLSPDLCAWAHFMQFELWSQHLSKKNTNFEKFIAVLKEAAAAGRAFAELIRADDFCKGNYYSFEPTRWLVRSLYVLGSFLFFRGDVKGADRALKECLAHDIHDKLGARHKQLLVALDQGYTVNDDMTWLLQAKFGADQIPDKTMALWNYSRALYAFCKNGDCKASKKLLAHAIDKNPHVPPLLLAWELPKEPQVLMRVHGDSEAMDYVFDNSAHWMSVSGALGWLEQIYCQITGDLPLSSDREAVLLLVEGTRLMQDERVTDGTSQRAAIDRFERLLEICNRNDESSNRTLRKKCLERTGLCHVMVNDHSAALIHYNSALCLCDLSDTESVKELLYSRAECKEDMGDLSGSLQDFTFVYQRIGKFSTAIEGIKRLEAKMNVRTSVIPPSPDFGVYEGEDEMRKTMEEISQHMPQINPSSTVAHNLERCSHCQRGGVKLAKCSGCREASFCSRECLRNSWKKSHKYVCKASNNRLEEGTQVVVVGLESAKQHNGKTVTIVGFLKEKGRFSVELPSLGGQLPVMLSIRPQNLKKMDE